MRTESRCRRWSPACRALFSHQRLVGLIRVTNSEKLYVANGVEAGVIPSPGQGYNSPMIAMTPHHQIRKCLHPFAIKRGNPSHLDQDHVSEVACLNDSAVRARTGATQILAPSSSHFEGSSNEAVGSAVQHPECPGIWVSRYNQARQVSADKWPDYTIKPLEIVAV